MGIKDIKCHYCRSNNSYILLISSRLPVVRWSTRHSACFTVEDYIYFLITSTAHTMGWFVLFGPLQQGSELRESPVDVRSGWSAADEGQRGESLLQLGIVNTLPLKVLTVWLGCRKEMIIRTVNGWKYLRTIKMWFIFRTSLNCLSFISPGCHCVFNLTEALLLRVPCCLSHTYRWCSCCTIFSSPSLCQKGELTDILRLGCIQSTIGEAIPGTGYI